METQYGLVQVVDAVTHGSNILDQVYTNRSDIYHAVVFKSLIKTKHMSVVVSSRPNDFQQAHACTAPKRKRTLLYDLREHNIDRLCYHVAMHWNDHLQCTDVQSVYDLFLRDVSMLILCNIPTKFVTVGPRDPSYVTPLVRSLLNKRRRKRRRLDEANILAGKINLLIQ